MTALCDVQAMKEPVVIIGAPRSGTNMLRDALCGLQGFTTWPCDEINYIWRHGNVRTHHDELTPDQATARVRRYIRGQFARRGRTGEQVVEKTCANSLRVAFVERVLPQARFVWIIRDGRDAVPSMQRRWHAKLGLTYVAAKARFIPPADLPYYAGQHLLRRAHRLRSADGRLGSWGPRLHDMDELLARRSFAEVCAIQWRRCVDEAGRHLAEVDPTRVHQVRYEDLVDSPTSHLSEIAAFAGQPAHSMDVRAAVSHVAPNRVSTPRSALTAKEREQIEPILAPTLATHGYA